MEARERANESNRAKWIVRIARTQLRYRRPRVLPPGVNYGVPAILKREVLANGNSVAPDIRWLAMSGQGVSVTMHTLSRFIRSASRGNLRAHFHWSAIPLPTELNWDASATTFAKGFLRAVDQLAEHQRAQLEIDAERKRCRA